MYENSELTKLNYAIEETKKCNSNYFSSDDPPLLLIHMKHKHIIYYIALSLLTLPTVKNNDELTRLVIVC